MIYEHRQLERRSVAGRVRNIIAAAAVALAAGAMSTSAFGESVTVSNTAGPVHTSSATEEGATYDYGVGCCQ